jgi:hypothetical protein
MIKKILPVLTLIGALASGANAFAQNRNVSDSGSPNISSKNLEFLLTGGQVIDTFTLPSVREGYEGVPFTYEVLISKNGLYARRKDEPQTTFLLSAFYDIDNNGIYGAMENKLIKFGIPMHMTKTFTDRILAAFTNYIKGQDKIAQSSAGTEAGIGIQPVQTQSEKDLNGYSNIESTPLEVQAENPVTPVPLQTEVSDLTLTLPAEPAEQKSEQAEAQKQETLATETPIIVIPLTAEIKEETPNILSETTIPREKDYRSVYLLTQGTFNNALDAYETSIGARVNPFKNADIGFGANLDLGFGLDKLTDSYSNTFTNGKIFSGTVTDMDKFSISGSLETQLGPFFLGGGIDYKLWTTKVIEQILSSSGDVLKSNTNSVPNRQVFGKVYGGIEFPLGDNFKLGVTAGYNWKDGAYFGIRTGIKLK